MCTQYFKKRLRYTSGVFTSHHFVCVLVCVVKHVTDSLCAVHSGYGAGLSLCIGQWMLVCHTPSVFSLGGGFSQSHSFGQMHFEGLSFICNILFKCILFEMVAYFVLECNRFMDGVVVMSSWLISCVICDSLKFGFVNYGG